MKKEDWKEKLDDVLATLFFIVVVIPLLVLTFILAPIKLIKDTIEAGGGIVWYTSSGHGRFSGTHSNYEYFALLAFLYGVFIWYFIKTKREQKLKKQKEQEINRRQQELTDEEKEIQHKMDETLENISFLGFIPNKKKGNFKKKGRFCCQSCHYEWEAYVHRIYSRKQCRKCSISYRK